MSAKGKHGSATVFILRDDGHVLAVSRGEDVTDWGMPGGFLERGETPAEGAARELAEETGLLVSPFDLRPIYEQGGCTTFALAGPVTVLRRPMSSVPFEGHVAWVPLETIASPRATFGRTNRTMLRDFGLL